MTGINNKGTSKSVRLTMEERGSAVIEVENLNGDYGHEDILCILMAATVNAIHVIEDKTERRRIGEE
jgi:hypothetical protein